MKTLILILGVVLATGCATNKCATTEMYNDTRIVFAIDPNAPVYEDPNNPGVFYTENDTIWIEIKEELDRKGNHKITHKVLNK